jgi:hypothetical protein
MIVSILIDIVFFLIIWALFKDLQIAIMASLGSLVFEAILTRLKRRQA